MGVQHQLHMNSAPLDSSRSSSILHKRSMVGVDDLLLQMKFKLTSDCPDLQIVPIVGMGGTGKTALATNIYHDPLIKEHFYTRAWATISQQYSIAEIFTQILRELLNKEVDSYLSENELADMLYKYLFGRKYLIIMDDMWNIEAWERVRCFFPDNKNGSRIVITTRLSNLASELPGSDRVEMRFLDEHSSWELLSRTVFGESGCQLALEEIGKKIAKSCKGLPLSIVVVGGFLVKSKLTSEFWEYIEENLSSIVNSIEDESCLRILHMSYKQLPVHLKPCFLYMGIFPADEAIDVSWLTKLWVAEGFLRPKSGKSFEEIAEEYLNELNERNLILIHKLGSVGSIKECKIHDLLRELCLKEVEKEKFRIVSRPHSAEGVAITASPRRVFIFGPLNNIAGVDALQSVSLAHARSLIWGLRHERPPTPRLLRILDSARLPELENMFQSVNLRYLAIQKWDDILPSSIDRLWNLETLLVPEFKDSHLQDEIWSMPEIRHVKSIQVHLPDPPQNGIILTNLLTLLYVLNFKCSEEVIKRIPNIKKLGIVYMELDGRYCLNNLVCLHKLESLTLYFVHADTDFLQTLTFPHSLKKLNLRMKYSISMLKNIGRLPFLEKLQLHDVRFGEGKWETVEGQFRSLKYLKVGGSCNLKQWIMDSSHFPRLELLVLDDLRELEEIPLEVAEIPTLRSIEVIRCRESVAISAKRIVEEQEELAGEAVIQVLVVVWRGNEAVVESLASPNIRVVQTLFGNIIHI